MEKTKNTFQDGLIMDFSPDNTGATSLTSALNATILTFNGNEMSLQNDMGNGRVETAYLPEGYIPVGTCEFGDIIYIASYNPLTNRAQIGCFPSPERNISSEEIGGLEQSLNYTDFQVVEGGQPTGELKSTAVRKVLIDNRNTNPGDKYIIFSEQASANFEKFGELENSKKYLKLSVVSIDGTGKITYLDTDTHYYLHDTEGKTIYDHFISPKQIVNSTDIDEYRNMLQSGWNIFSSKNPGKLAILAELNTIDRFSCTYSVLVNEIPANKKYKDGAIKYTVYFTPTFDSNAEHKVYLSRETIYSTEEDGLKNIDGTNQFKVTKDQFEQTDLSIYLNNPTEEIPNYHDTNFDNFEGPITYPEPEPVKSGHNYLAFEIEIPYKNGELIKSGALIYSCNIIPAMPFGRLDYLKVPITIDFNKIGTGEVGLTRWRYYNYGTQCTLQYGLEIYNKPNYKTKKVIIDFYDNTGHAARYTLEDQDSFSGIRTEYLGFNDENYNYRLTKVKEIKDNKTVYLLHKGLEYREFDSTKDSIDDDHPTINGLKLLKQVDNERIDSEYVIESDGKMIYQNDAGKLYSNLLYAAHIQIYSSEIEENGEFKKDSSLTLDEQYWRWLWTNPMYNEYYYQVDDFGELKFQLDLDINAIFEAGNTYKWEDKVINNLDNNITDGCYHTYSANIQYIGQNGDGNINLYTSPGLQNDYGCFNLIENSTGGTSELDKFKLEIYLGKSTISYSDYNNNYEYSMSQIPLLREDEQFLSISKMNNYSNNITGRENAKFIDQTEEMNKEGTTINDTFNVCFAGATPEPIVLDDEEGEVTAQYIETNLSQCYYKNTENKKSIILNLAASLFTKAYVCGTQSYTGDCPTYSPIISNEQELNGYGISGIVTGGTAYLRMNTAFMGMVGGKDEEYSFSTLQTNNNIFNSADVDDNEQHKPGCNLSFNSYGNNTYTELYNQYVENNLNKFFIYYPGGDEEYTFTSIRGNSGFEEVRNGLNDRQPRPNYGNPIERKKYCIQFAVDEVIKGGIFLPDINNHTLHAIKPYSAVGILCMKHPSGGFVAFNTIYLDYDSTYEDNGGSYPQTAKLKSNVDYTQYPNFSFPLYILLSRIYTKNKTIPSNGETIKLPNYVKRSQYSTVLTKDVILKVSQKSDNCNIAMSGINYNEYKNNLLEVIKKVVSDESQINEEALHLSFSDCAKNTVLTLEVTNNSIDFPEIEDQALLSYNGMVIPCKKIQDEQFYIYYNGELLPYYDQAYKFTESVLTNNLSHILGKSITGINYITPAKVKIDTTELEKAADFLAMYYQQFYDSSDFRIFIEQVLENMSNHHGYGEEAIKDIILRHLESQFSSGSEEQYAFGTYFKTPQQFYQKWRQQFPTLFLYEVQSKVTNSQGDTMYQYLKKQITLAPSYTGEKYEFVSIGFNFCHADRYTTDLITITPQLSLSENFEYNNSLELKENSPHNMLKICMGHGGQNLGDRLNGLQCIMKDVSIDITHRITEN